ncbi:aspartic peptidase domain-containing protein [Gigaspora rosea]|uniref:Aspartic peptidase domain-containing protein n=1 Tax=Gigaspora rosea TaxID=44941 RepID=A0A397V5S7_9GLOM|nr:aspartic peptidase domain-containing protein [Gigaspora rosea]
MFDTGSPLFWIPDTNCKLTASVCNEKNKYNETKDKFSKSGIFDINYSIGQESGTKGSLDLSFLGHSVTGQTIGIANNINFPGMAFAFKFRRNGETSYLFIGNTDSSFEVGRITWTKLVDKNSFFDFFIFNTNPEYNEWIIPLNNLLVNNKALGFQNVLAKIDTGTSLINAPDDVPKKIYEQIPNSKAIGGFYYLPCNSKVLISAKFSGVIFNIDNRDIFDNTESPNNGLCKGTIQPNGPTSIFNNPTIIFGLFF